MVTFPVVALVAHSGEYLILFGHFAKYPALPDVMRQRFLAERVKPALHGAHRCWGVMVVRRGDQDDVQIFVTLIEHSPVVVVYLGLGIRVFDILESGGDRFVIDIHHRDQSL
jgi:hypothetical protein